MKLAELVNRSGVARTTIHYYLREGLLPEPRKAAPNTAEYDERHLNQLRLIRWLKSESGERLSIARTRRVIQLVEQGVPPEVAVALQRAVLDMDRLDGDASRRLNLNELADECGLSEKETLELINAGLVRAAPAVHGAKPFDFVDVHIARALGRVLRETGLQPRDGKPLAQLVEEQSRIEFELRNRVVAGLDPAEAASKSLMLQEATSQLRSYLFARAREHDIEGLSS